MTKWVALLLLAIPVAVFGGLIPYSHWRNAVFHEGYQHGAAHVIQYEKCFGVSPSEAWQKEAWLYINEDKDCEFYEGLRIKVGEKRILYPDGAQ